MELCRGDLLLLLRISIGNRDAVDGTMSVSHSDVAWGTNAMSVIGTPIQGDFFLSGSFLTAHQPHDFLFCPQVEGVRRVRRSQFMQLWMDTIGPA